MTNASGFKVLGIMELPPARKSFKAFRTLNRALTFMKGRGASAWLHVAHYGCDERDVRYVVNYTMGDVA